MKDVNMSVRKAYSNIETLEQKIAFEFNCHSTDSLNILRTRMFVGRNFRTISNDERLIKELDIIISLATLLLAQDSYLYLNHEIKLGSVDQDHVNSISEIIECLSSGEYESLFNDFGKVDKLIKTMFNMLNLSALRKVELFKALDEDAIELLSEANPYFMQEYEHYNIEISGNFLIKHLGIWEKMKDYETAICLVTNFIMNIYKLRADEGRNIVDILCDDEEKKTELLNYLEMREFDLVASFVSTFYDNNKSKQVKLK